MKSVSNNTFHFCATGNSLLRNLSIFIIFKLMESVLERSTQGRREDFRTWGKTDASIPSKIH